ncbi:MBL fold metallo-hydrolase [Paenibacillus rigui]|nr:MBL fold metallo-hydrolase [Paenibacillus rigui]
MAYFEKARTGAEIIREIETTKVPYGMLAIWFIGQCGVILKGGKTVIFIDPYLAPSPSRAFDPPFHAEAISHADYVFITHEHSDHLDIHTIEILAASHPSIRYVTPGYCRDKMIKLGVKEDRLLTLRTDEWRREPGFRVKALPSAHEELDYDPELGYRCVGYVFELNGVKLYHAGDTVVYPGLVESLETESIDLGMLPINGRDLFRNARNIVGNMNFREAAELAVAAGFDTVVPLHYDMFRGNGEHPGYFVDYLYERHPTQKSHVMARFERYIYVSRAALV